jgi:elongator complex protein 4
VYVPLFIDQSAAMLKTFRALRGVVRSSGAICMVTVPAHLYSDSVVKQLEHQADVVLKFESFSGHAVDMSASDFKDFDGLIHVEKIAKVNAFTSPPTESFDFLFKLRRKNMAIERLYLPPESSRSTQTADQHPIDPLNPNVSAPMGSCGSSLGGGSTSARGTTSNQLDF